MTAYRSSEEILTSILEYEKAQDEFGMNGFILLSHIGTAPARTDKFYLQLDSLIIELSKRGYQFVGLKQLLD